MAMERIETGKAPQIEIAKCGGDLVIRPWMELGVQAKGSYELTESEGNLVFQADSDLNLLVPSLSVVHVGHVHGDLLIKGVQGDVQISETSGDAVLLNLAQVSIKQISGDLSAKHLNGPLKIGAVSGDALLRSVDGEIQLDEIHGDLAVYFAAGAVTIEQVMGDANIKTVNGNVAIKTVHRDANLRNLGGTCQLHNVHGDIRLRGSLSVGEHSFNAAGDIVFRWPVTAPLQLVATAPEIVNRLPLQDIKDIDDGLTGRIGDGDTVVTLRASGRILLKEGRLVDEKWDRDPKEDFDMDFMIDFADLGERISNEVSQSMANLTKELENSFGSEFADQVSAKVSREAEKAAQKAEAAAERARRYAERQAARAQRHQQRSPYYPSPEPAANEPAAQSRVSSDEQMKILKMVEKGTISPDEASELLEALE